MRRGRPPYPDVLTPREWEVLGLLKEGLTNEEIAGRLEISHNGAKYHVAEILSKLGMHSRYDAAAWQSEAPFKRLPVHVLPFLAGLQRRFPSTLVAKSATATLIVAALGLIAVLAIGLLVMDQRRGGEWAQQSAAIQADDVMEVLSRFASDRGMVFDGPCRGNNPAWTLCYSRIEELQGARQVILRNQEAAQQYTLLLEPDANRRLQVTSVSGPERITIAPPTSGPAVSPPTVSTAIPNQATPGASPPGLIPPPNP
jgi:DNA-binding CsgD family transcriptional regulator